MNVFEQFAQMKPRDKFLVMLFFGAAFFILGVYFTYDVFYSWGINSCTEQLIGIDQLVLK